MATVKGYFQNIFENVRTIAIGMKITIKYCFQKTVTVHYPEHRLSFAPRYRGIHEFEADKCIACDLCAKACPVDCIYIDKSAPRKIDKKTGKAAGGELLRFAIDYSKCLFCALCTEPCPTLCIHMGKLHDLSSYTRKEVVVEFAELAKEGLNTPIPLWMEKNRDRIGWVKEEYDRVKSRTLATTAADIVAVK
ncbi:MAG: NADH-quinone oxidoreductase subunit I [Phycisphaerales bacterium]|jgi:NADH-quinone oxidoreductase subunit I|nr:NADH-quinone oxidoreductase subunit I [Phycisphaerales bacterium]